MFVSAASSISICEWWADNIPKVCRVSCFFRRGVVITQHVQLRRTCWGNLRPNQTNEVLIFVESLCFVIIRAAERVCFSSESFRLTHMSCWGFKVFLFSVTHFCSQSVLFITEALRQLHRSKHFLMVIVLNARHLEFRETFFKPPSLAVVVRVGVWSYEWDFVAWQVCICVCFSFSFFFFFLPAVLHASNCSPFAG